MGAHLILMGPSTAGKSTLMKGLSESDCKDFDYAIDRTWTTRQRRSNEGDTENIFVTPEELEMNDCRFLFRFQTYSTYEYAIETPKPLKTDEIRLRILMPVFAQRFRLLVPEPTYFCAISPFHNNPNNIFYERGASTDLEDIRARSARFTADQLEAEKVANISFQNVEGVETAVNLLRGMVESFFQKPS